MSGKKKASNRDKDTAPFFDTPPPYSPYEVTGPSTSHSQPTSPQPVQNSIVINVNGGNGTPSAQVVPQPEVVLGGNKVFLHSSEKADRTIFCRNVYAILAVQGAIVCGIISTLLYIPHFRSYFQDVGFFKFWPAWIIGTICACFVTTLYKLMRNPPVNLVLLALVTVASGFIMGTLAARLERQDSVVICVGIVAIICLLVVVFTFQSRFPFTPTYAMCYVWLLNLIAYGILCLCFWGEFGDCAYLMIAPWVVTTYFVTTTQLLMKDREKAITNVEFVYGAVQVSMYLVALFAKILYRIFDKCCPCCSCCCSGCDDVCNEL